MGCQEIELNSGKEGVPSQKEPEMLTVNRWLEKLSVKLDDDYGLYQRRMLPHVQLVCRQYSHP